MVFSRKIFRPLRLTLKMTEHMNAAEIKQELERLDVKPNRHLGQNFLIDTNILNKIVEVADIKKGDQVLEIGPGLGVLTSEMIDRGAQVIAIEKDRRFAEYLVGAIHELPVRIIQGDATTLHWHELIGDQPWKFVSNLPYQITSFALRKALWSPNPPQVVVALVQKEVAQRVIASKARQSLLSLMVALSSESASIIKKVSKNSFYPIPKVESAVLQIVPMPWPEREKKWGINPEEIMKVARLGFAHPRKMLVSNLKSLQVTASILKDLNINEKARAEDLSPKDWAKLTVSLQG